LTQHEWLAALLRACHFDPRYFPEVLTVVVLMYLSLLLFARAIRSLFATLYDASRFAAEVVALVALIGLQSMFNYQNYIYDLPTIAIFAVGLTLLAQRRLLAFFIVYSIGLFSKETVVLLAAVFALDQWRVMRFSKFAGSLILLGTSFVMSRLVLHSLYSRNLGDYLLPQLLNHNVALLHSYAPAGLATSGLLAIVVFGHWSYKPSLVRHALWIALPLVASCVFYGFLDELRDYYEIYPIVVMLGSLTVGRMMGVPITKRPEGERRPFVEWIRDWGLRKVPDGAPYTMRDGPVTRLALFLGIPGSWMRPAGIRSRR